MAHGLCVLVGFWGGIYSFFLGYYTLSIIGFMLSVFGMYLEHKREQMELNAAPEGPAVNTKEAYDYYRSVTEV